MKKVYKKVHFWKNHISSLEIHYFFPVKCQLIMTNHCILRFLITVRIPLSSLTMDCGRWKFSELRGDQKNCFNIRGGGWGGFMGGIILNMMGWTYAVHNFFHCCFFLPNYFYLILAKRPLVIFKRSMLYMSSLKYNCLSMTTLLF